jgi:integrase
VIADQARALERVTSELRWHGLDEAALTVREAIDGYRRARQGEKCWRGYKYLLAPMVRLLGDLPCLQLTPERWAEHRQARMLEPHRAGARPSSAVLDLELSLAKMVFRWLVRAGKLPRNPLDLAKGANEPNGRETFLPAADVQRLVDGADCLGDETDAGKRRVLLFRAFVLILFGCALRFNEARKLRRDRIDAEGTAELSARQTKARRRRTVALPADALAALKALPVLDGEPRIFSHATGRSGRGRVGIVSESALRRWFDKVCDETGVARLAFEGERVTPHVLRHSAAVHADAMGAHPRDVQEFLDHESLATTERYLRRRPAQRAQRIRALMEKRIGE